MDGKPVRTIEYDMRDFMQSCIQLYSDLVAGSSRNIILADLPTDTASGGGNAPAPKYGDRWEHFPDHKAWMGSS